MRQQNILFTALVLMLACMVARGQDVSKQPAVTLTASPAEIAMPLQYNRACIVNFHERNPNVGRMNEPVTLKAKAVNLGMRRLQYGYSVTGGRIEGEGSSVTWNLIGAAPGKYTATVEVKNSKGSAIWSSTTVTISTFHCESEWFSFSAEISCPLTDVPAGELAIVSVKAERAPPDAVIGYEWTVTAGKIKSGQGTSSISIDTTEVEGPLTASVKLKGVAPGNKSEYSCTLIITHPNANSKSSGR